MTCCVCSATVARAGSGSKAATYAVLSCTTTRLELSSSFSRLIGRPARAEVGAVLILDRSKSCRDLDGDQVTRRDQLGLDRGTRGQMIRQHPGVPDFVDRVEV